MSTWLARFSGYTVRFGWRSEKQRKSCAVLFGSKQIPHGFAPPFSVPYLIDPLTFCYTRIFPLPIPDACCKCFLGIPVVLVSYCPPTWLHGSAFHVCCQYSPCLLPMLSLLATITLAYSVLNLLICLYVLFPLCYSAILISSGKVLQCFSWCESSVSLVRVSVDESSFWLPVLTQVFDQPEKSKTGGLYFPLAVSNLCEMFFLLPVRLRLFV